MPLREYPDFGVKFTPGQLPEPKNEQLNKLQSAIKRVEIKLLNWGTVTEPLLVRNILHEILVAIRDDLMPEVKSFDGVLENALKGEANSKLRTQAGYLKRRAAATDEFASALHGHLCHNIYFKSMDSVQELYKPPRKEVYKTDEGGVWDYIWHFYDRVDRVFVNLDARVQLVIATYPNGVP